MASDAPDSELIAAIVAGGASARDAERELCRRYAPRILGYGLRHLRDADRANDLVQSVLIGLLEAARAGRIENPEHVDRYVLGVCRNTAIRMREHQNRALPLPHEALAELAVVPAAAEKVDLGSLLRCFDRLPARDKEILLLSFNEGHDAAEIAARVALSAVNVRVTRHRAVLALRRCLDVQPEAGA